MPSGDRNQYTDGLYIPLNAKYRKAWEWPECPRCETPVFVQRPNGEPRSSPRYVCLACESLRGRDEAIFTDRRYPKPGERRSLA